MNDAGESDQHCRAIHRQRASSRTLPCPRANRPAASNRSTVPSCKWKSHATECGKMVEQASAAAESMRDQAATLVNLVARFKGQARRWSAPPAASSALRQAAQRAIRRPAATAPGPAIIAFESIVQRATPSRIAQPSCAPSTTVACCDAFRCHEIEQPALHRFCRMASRCGARLSCNCTSVRRNCQGLASSALI